MQAAPWDKPWKGDVAEYSTIEPTLQTFDVCLWSGTGNLSRFIQYGTGSPWSHVGMVVKAGDFLLLYESTIREEGKGGVQTSLLKNAIGGRVCTRQLSGLTDEVRQGAEEQLGAAMRELDGRPFEKNTWEFLKAGYDGPLGLNTRDLSSVFCAELVAEVLQRAGVLVDDQPSNEFTPADFASDAQTPLQLAAGLSYGAETYLQASPRYYAQALGRESDMIKMKIPKGLT